MASGGWTPLETKKVIFFVGDRVVKSLDGSVDCQSHGLRARGSMR